MKLSGLRESFSVFVDFLSCGRLSGVSVDPRSSARFEPAVWRQRRKQKKRQISAAGAEVNVSNDRKVSSSLPPPFFSYILYFFPLLYTSSFSSLPPLIPFLTPSVYHCFLLSFTLSPTFLSWSPHFLPCILVSFTKPHILTCAAVLCRARRPVSIKPSWSSPLIVCRASLSHCSAIGCITWHHQMGISSRSPTYFNKGRNSAVTFIKQTELRSKFTPGSVCVCVCLSVKINPVRSTCCIDRWVYWSLIKFNKV